MKIFTSKHKALKAWWRDADDTQRAAMVSQLSNAESLQAEAPGVAAVEAFLESCDDNALQELEKIKLPVGRAAYSVDSLERLTTEMLNTGCDLFTARKEIFGVANDWRPPADPIGMPVGNPAVDRVLKIVNRWLLAAERKWGAPTTINIEHVRSAFASEAATREYLDELNKRAARNQKILADLESRLGIKPAGKSAAVTKYMALCRQRCSCLYCGTDIDYFTAEMDHIVPRKGLESTNSRVNLAAVCKECNLDKSNTAFALWAENTSRPNVSLKTVTERVKNLNPFDNLYKKELTIYKKEVLLRLRKRTPDEAIDARSVESVAWMARELRSRVHNHFNSAGTTVADHANAQVTVNAYAGGVVASARRFTGFTGRVQLLGENSKTRFDKRHHAMDAAVIALMRSSVAQTLATRSNLQQTEELQGRKTGQWKQYTGADIAAQKIYEAWQQQMQQLLELFNEALQQERIPVIQNLRLSLGSGKAHDDIVRPFARGKEAKRLGDAWSVQEIDRASTPQLWLALTRLPDFDAKNGLPADPTREIRVKHEWYGATDVINIFPKKIAAIKVRKGWAEIGGTIHHGRIYRLPAKKEAAAPEYGYVRVFSQDLLGHQHEDLFSVPLKPESISLRTAQDKVRAAIVEGSAEFITWVVTGMEIQLDLAKIASFNGELRKFLEIFPLRQWRITGLADETRITIKPMLIAEEGIKQLREKSSYSKEQLDQLEKTMKVGIKVTLNVFLPTGVRFVHRTALGTERVFMPARRNSLPVSVEV